MMRGRAEFDCVFFCGLPAALFYHLFLPICRGRSIRLPCRDADLSCFALHDAYDPLCSGNPSQIRTSAIQNLDSGNAQPSNLTLTCDTIRPSILIQKRPLPVIQPAHAILMIDLGHQRLKVWVLGRIVEIGQLLHTLLLQCALDGGEFAFAGCSLGWGESAEEGGRWFG